MWMIGYRPAVRMAMTVIASAERPIAARERGPGEEEDGRDQRARSG